VCVYVSVCMFVYYIVCVYVCVRERKIERVRDKGLLIVHETLQCFQGATETQKTRNLPDFNTFFPDSTCSICFQVFMQIIQVHISVIIFVCLLC
jgi:hypothetical protein